MGFQGMAVTKDEWTLAPYRGLSLQEPVMLSTSFSLLSYIIRYRHILGRGMAPQGGWDGPMGSL